MKIIDLSLPIYTGMPVYPWDSEMNLEQIQNIDQHDWNMKRLHINTHDGTHVNVPIHCMEWGKTLDDYSVTDFIWPARIYQSNDDIIAGEGLVFHKGNISWDIAEKIIQTRPSFIALSQEFEFDIELERYLLEHNIISFERLENTHLLPKTFMFYGVPLKIRQWDGSPVRAFAMIA